MPCKKKGETKSLLNRFAHFAGPYCIPVATCCVLVAIVTFYGSGSWFNRLEGRGQEGYDKEERRSMRGRMMRAQEQEEQASPRLLVALLRASKAVDKRLLWVASWDLSGGLWGLFGRGHF